MAAKIGWLRECYAGMPGARFHQPTSYLLERLCGVYAFDHGLASTTMLYNLADGDYDERLLSLFSLGRQCLPSIAAADSLAGTLSAAAAARFGLEEGTPMAVGTGDDFAGRKTSVNGIKGIRVHNVVGIHEDKDMSPCVARSGIAHRSNDATIFADDPAAA